MKYSHILNMAFEDWVAPGEETSDALEYIWFCIIKQQDNLRQKS